MVSEWILIFHHDSTFGMFSRYSEARYSMNKNKFSVIGRIDDSFKINEKFEFMLKYPNISGQNHWTQTVNPIHAQPNVLVNDTWFSNNWHGLSLSNDKESTFIDGSPFNSDTCYYAIGCMYKSLYIPGPEWSLEGKQFTQVDLYIKVNDMTLVSKLFNRCTVRNRNDHFIGKTKLSVLTLTTLRCCYHVYKKANECISLNSSNIHYYM